MKKPTTDSAPKFINPFCSSIPPNQTTPSKNGQKISTDNSPKKTYRWPRNTWKYIQRHSLWVKCTSIHYEVPPYASRMTTTQKATSYKYCRGCGAKGTLLHCWWECKLVQPLWKTLRRFLKKLKMELPFDQAILLLGIYPEKTTTQKDTCTPVFIAALYTIAKTWKQPKRPSKDEWIKKMEWHIHDGMTSYGLLSQTLEWPWWDEWRNKQLPLSSYFICFWGFFFFCLSLFF